MSANHRSDFIPLLRPFPAGWMDNIWSYLKADVYQVGALALAASSILSGLKSAENFYQWRSLKNAFVLNVREGNTYLYPSICS